MKHMRLTDFDILVLLRTINLYLSGHIDDLHCIILAFVLDNFAERIFDGGIVTINEQIIHKLDCQ